MYVVDLITLALALYTWTVMRDSLFLASHAFIYYFELALGVVSFSFFLYTTMTDPGILLRN
jgi:hypothetical protein